MNSFPTRESIKKTNKIEQLAFYNDSDKWLKRLTSDSMNADVKNKDCKDD